MKYMSEFKEFRGKSTSNRVIIVDMVEVPLLAQQLAIFPNICNSSCTVKHQRLDYSALAKIVLCNAWIYIEIVKMILRQRDPKAWSIR